MSTLTVAKAKPNLGKLIDKAAAGKTIFIERPRGKHGRLVVQLVPVPVPEPIPHYPAGALEINRARVEAMDTYPVADNPFAE